jgi:tetratricopeptide (TPR) repeat protein
MAIQSKLCTWCGSGFDPNDGNGYLFDSDMNQSRIFPAIPICGGCGGLGVQFDTEDFKTRVNRIKTLRFQFCPIDPFPDPPTAVYYVALTGLIKEINALTKAYGFGNDNSFARDFKNNFRLYRDMLSIMEMTMNMGAQKLKETPLYTSKVYAQAAMGATIKCFTGQIDEGIKQLKDLCEKYPNDSELINNLGTLCLLYKRDSDEAMKCLIKSTTLEPRKSLHFLSVAQLFHMLKNDQDTLVYLKLIKEQPDYQEFKKSVPFNVEAAIRSLES